MIIKPNDVKNVMISGVFITFGIIAIMIFIFMLSNESSLFAPKISLKAEVQNVQNLKTGSAVQLRGMRVGTVSSIDIKNINKIHITANIDSRYQEWIREDSYFSFRTQGVLGDRYLEILGGSPESNMVKDQSFLSVEDDSPIDMFITKGEDLLIVAGRVLQRLDVILENVEEEQIGGIVENLSKTSISLAELTKIMEQSNMNEMFSNMSSASKELESTANSISRITQQVEHGPGTLNSLIYDNTLHQDVQTLLGGAQRNRLIQFFLRESIKKGDD